MLLLINFLQAMQHAAADKFPTGNVYIYDISLVNTLNRSEKADLKVEENYFQNYSMHGEVSSEPIVAPKPKIMGVKQLTLGLDSLTHVIDRINQQINTPDPHDVSRIIYVHCEGGCDRTGAVMGAYQMFEMKHSKKLSAETALAKTRALCKRPPNWVNRMMVKNYCQSHGGDDCDAWN